MIFKRDDDDADPVEATAPATARREDQMADQNGEVTIVGAGARLEGNVVSAGSLRIDGQVKGQINADGDVALSPQSQVEADIRAQNVSVAGRLQGEHHRQGEGPPRARRPRRREHHVEDPRRRGGRDLPRAEHHGRWRVGSSSSSSGQAGTSQGAQAAAQTEKGTDQVKVP